MGGGAKREGKDTLINDVLPKGISISPGLEPWLLRFQSSVVKNTQLNYNTLA